MIKWTYMEVYDDCISVFYEDEYFPPSSFYKVHVKYSENEKKIYYKIIEMIDNPNKTILNMSIPYNKICLSKWKDLIPVCAKLILQNKYKDLRKSRL